MEAAQRAGGDYWRPVTGSVKLVESVLPQEPCSNCATRFAIGARYCYVCGEERERRSPQTEDVPGLLHFDSLRQRLGLTVPSLVCLLLGVVCLLTAVGMGYALPIATEAGWQPVEAYRLEWLLGAIAAFLAGLLLKKVRPVV